MEIIKEQNGEDLVLKIKGIVNTTTAPELQNVIDESLDGIKNLTFEIGEMDYITSAGVRTFLAAQKIMNKQGAMKVIHANADVYEVFELIGFNKFINFEDRL